MIRRDCAYCMDLNEYGALCDNAVNLSCGEPVDARCDGCRLYERRLSTHEMLKKIHSLESKLRESNTWRRTYEDMVVPLKAENAKLRELVDELCPLADYGAMDASELDRAHDLMRELGIEVGE